MTARWKVCVCFQHPPCCPLSPLSPSLLSCQLCFCVMHASCQSVNCLDKCAHWPSCERIACLGRFRPGSDLFWGQCNKLHQINYKPPTRRRRGTPLMPNLVRRHFAKRSPPAGPKLWCALALISCLYKECVYMHIVYIFSWVYGWLLWLVQLLRTDYGKLSKFVFNRVFCNTAMGNSPSTD